MDNEEYRVEFLSFDTFWPPKKKRMMHKRIAEIELEGWTFHRAKAVNPLKSLRYLGGALNLHFRKAGN